MDTTYNNMSTDELITLRTQAATAYYGMQTDVIMSDKEFDALLEELDSRGVEQIIGHGYEPTGEKVYHAYPMQSLAKAKTLDQIIKWLDTMPTTHTVIQPKYDGLGLSLIYKDGNLHQAATRGDHVKGDDMTLAALAMSKASVIPQRINAQGTTHVRGEIIITYTDFAALNDFIENDGHRKEKYSSERNAAAGVLRKNDPETIKYLSFVAYETDAQTDDDINTLSSWGFLTPKDHFYKHLDGTEEMMETLFDLDVQRKKFDFETDGAVIKIDASTEDREQIGRGSKNPKWALAYKYEDSPSSTIIRDIVWSQRRTGKLTPIAIFDEVTLTGNAKTTKASLANFAKFQRLNLHKNDHILVIRANGVIPFVIGVDPAHPRSEDDAFVAPAEFPENSGLKTKLSATGLELFAHEEAPEPVVAKIENSLNVLDIKGVGPAIIESLSEYSNAKNFLDILVLDENQIAEAMGYDKPRKASSNVYNALQKSFEAPLWRWIAAIGMRLIAKTKSPILEEAFGSLEALADASLMDLMTLERFGQTNAQTVYDNQKEIAQWAERLKSEHDFTPTPEKKVEVVSTDANDFVNGKKVVVTGVFPTLSRKDVETWVKNNGGTISSSVSSTTDLVIYGDKAGSKLNKAESLNIETMTAEEFESRI